MNKIFELDNTDYHYDDDIESFEYREVRHKKSDNSMENATYNFFIQDTNANILYSNGYVQQKLRIVNDNGTTEIESNINYSALMLQVLGLIHFTPDYSSSEATNMFFYMDTSDNADRRHLKFHGTLTDATKITDFFKNLVTNEKGSYTIKATSDEVLSLYVIPQYTDRYENAKENNMLFDNLDMTECYRMINNIKVPTVSYMMDFEKEDYNRIYASLLESGLNTITSETGCMVNYSNFGKLYPIICFNLAHHQNYTDTNNLTIEFNWRLRNNPAKNYVFYFILQECKKCYLNIKNQDITMIKTLKL
ncbi:uncharacterized protein TNCV_2176931 [Trichonephila clavipes]|uniref:Uncharacterized protein n=1 Tax=Trichonephila clavipes TaxID=2585209 RepID=A0A8X6VTY3_TRICX|nr:uncharacterized protein TNCV_2176931 [Trichonephila clavipes]